MIHPYKALNRFTDCEKHIFFQFVDSVVFFYEKSPTLVVIPLPDIAFSSYLNLYFRHFWIYPNVVLFSDAVFLKRMKKIGKENYSADDVLFLYLIFCFTNTHTFKFKKKREKNTIQYNIHFYI
jgi:hypothetical protein